MEKKDCQQGGGHPGGCCDPDNGRPCNDSVPDCPRANKRAQDEAVRVAGNNPGPHWGHRKCNK